MYSSPTLATPAMAIAEYSSARNTFSTSRLEIMFPAVARRSPAITTPRSVTTATIVVACGRLLITSAATSESPASGPRSLAGRMSGAYEERKCVNDGMRAAMKAAWSRSVPLEKPPTPLPPCCSGGSPPRVNTALSLSRHYRPFGPLLNSAVAPSFSPTANRSGRGDGGLLAALLDVRTDELLGVLLKHLVDFVEDRVHVVGELL